MIVLEVTNRQVDGGSLQSRRQQLAADLRIFHAIRDLHKTATLIVANPPAQAESRGESSREGGER